jgi:hypothetical protein
MIDWSPVTTALIALISMLIATLAPVLVRAVTDAVTAQLTKAKALADKNQAIAKGIVEVIQNTYKAYTNSQKYQAAFEKLNAELHLPSKQLQQLIEQAVSGLTLAWGEDWAKLGEPTIPPTPTIEKVEPIVEEGKPIEPLAV